MKKKTPKENLMGMAEFCELLGMSVIHVRRLVREKKIPIGRKIQKGVRNSHYKFDRNEVRAWIAGEKIEPKE